MVYQVTQSSQNGTFSCSMRYNLVRSNIKVLISRSFLIHEVYLFVSGHKCWAEEVSLECLENPNSEFQKVRIVVDSTGVVTMSGQFSTDLDSLKLITWSNSVCL